MSRPRVIFQVSDSQKPTALARQGERLSSNVTTASTSSGELMEESESSTSQIDTEREESLYQQSSSSISRNGESSDSGGNGSSSSASASGGSSNSQLYKSINRLFSSTYARDPRFPETPPRHHSPDAIPYSHSHRYSHSHSHSHSHRNRIPPLDYAPYVRPAILNPYSDIYSTRLHHSAHLIYPMSSFATDLTLALEAIVGEEEEGEQDDEKYGRPLYGPQFTPPPEGQRDMSGLYRPRETNAPSSSLNPSEGSSSSRNGNGSNGNGNGGRK
ncbi:hypothetical protein JCM5350_000073 [Sporobolomyces pararoseus]